MKICWSPDHKSIVLIAETKYEVAFGEIFVDGLKAHQYAKSKNSAKWSIIPDEALEIADKVQDAGKPGMYYTPAKVTGEVKI